MIFPWVNPWFAFVAVVDLRFHSPEFQRIRVADSPKGSTLSSVLGEFAFCLVWPDWPSGCFKHLSTLCRPTDPTKCRCPSISARPTQPSAGAVLPSGGRNSFWPTPIHSMRLAGCVDDEQVPSAASSYYLGIGAVQLAMGNNHAG